MDLEDAKVFAKGIIEAHDKAEFYGVKPSLPAARTANLARAFLQLVSPICCHAATRCNDCPMRLWDIKPESWLNPLSKVEPNSITNKAVVGRRGIKVRVKGQDYRSINAAARALGVHKDTIKRMVLDGE